MAEHLRRKFRVELVRNVSVNGYRCGGRSELGVYIFIPQIRNFPLSFLPFLSRFFFLSSLSHRSIKYRAHPPLRIQCPLNGLPL